MDVVNEGFIDYGRFATLCTKNICRIGPLTVSEKHASQYGDRTCPELLRLECADLYLIESRYKIGGNLSPLLFGYSIGRILGRDTD
jgi:hypothetical protein